MLYLGYDVSVFATSQSLFIPSQNLLISIVIFNSPNITFVNTMPTLSVSTIKRKQTYSAYSIHIISKVKPEVKNYFLLASSLHLLVKLDYVLLFQEVYCV